jgi:hypothetical protein
MSEDQKPAPRTLEEINKEYTTLCSKAGELQYRVEIEKIQIAQINQKLQELNKEGAERFELDKKAAEVKIPEVVNG